MDLPQIPFDAPAGVLDLAVTCRSFAESALGRSGGLQLAGMETRFVWDRCESLGRGFHMKVCFSGERLIRVELELIIPGEKAGWENWSQETERRRKEEGERWLAEVFRQPCDVLPLEIDGTSVMPFEQKWDNLKGIRFPWGEALSFFDSKGGFSGLSIRMGARGGA